MLESYIAPLFMGYVDKYIKNLKPSDLSLSFWGGDVVLQNLDLNLDVLQQELNLPIKFLSGRIHKLQIHVPWTRLVYEPVVITIDTMEFIVKLKDSSDLSSTSNVEATSEEPENKMPSVPPPNEEQLPPGYVQSILNKVINNVSFEINNIIIKYVEDDIVFSLNVKSVALYSSDKNWTKAFTELSLPELLLRKVCEITDLTICLDQQNSSGRIELYQDPVLYKCNLTCRILSHYKGLNSLKPFDNRIDVYCESFDFSLTDHQIPMLIRLIQLLLALYFGMLDLPGCNFKQHTAPRVIEEHKKEQSRLSNTLSDEVPTDADTSWSSWAWSMVPGSGTADQQLVSQLKQDVKTTFGIYVTQTTFTFKKTSQQSDLILANQRLEFSPVMCLEFSGCIFEFVSIGDLLIDMCIGVQGLVGYTIGKQCVCCSVTDETDEESVMDEVFLKCGLANGEANALSFLKRSIFASTVSMETTTNETVDNELNVANSPTDNQQKLESISLNLDWLENGQDLENVTEYKPGSKLSETEIVDRYGIIFLNYFYEMTLPVAASVDVENIFLYPETDDKVHEVSEKQVFLSDCKVYLTTKFMHGLKWLYSVFNVKIPARKVKSETFLDPFVLQQLHLGNLLSRKISLTCKNSELYILTNDHEEAHFEKSNCQDEKEAVILQVDNFSLSKIDPMYPTELISMVEKGKLVKLNRLENLHSHMDIFVEGFQAGVTVFNQETFEAFSIFLVQPTDLKLRSDFSIMPVTFDGKIPIIHADYNFSCDSATFLLTKTQFLLFREVLFSWSSPRTKTFIPSLLNDVFNNQGFTENNDTSDEKNTFAPLMNIDLKDFSLHFVDMKELQGISVSLASVRATVQSMDEKRQIEETLFFQSPCKTTEISKVDTWLSKSSNKETCNYLNLKVQYQKTMSPSKFVQLADIHLSGASINFDPLFFEWLTYQVDFQTKRRIRSVRTQGTSLLNQSITTPRRTKSYVRVFSGSNTSQSHQSRSKREGIEDMEIEDDINEGKNKHFGDWLVQKINFFKSFHIKINLQPVMMIFPQVKWPQGFNHTDHIDMMRKIYNSENSNFPSTMVLCSPEIDISSSNQDENLFDQALPLLVLQKRKAETLPWTISSKNMALYCLFPNVEEVFLDGKFENTYICKPMSWNIFLASVVPNKTVSSKDLTLEIITENEHSDKQQDRGIPSRSVWIPEKHSSVESKYQLGFVLHMDWSICEIFVSHTQLKLGSCILNNVYLVSKSLKGIRDNNKTTVVMPNETGTILKEEMQTKTADSPSTSSVLDQVDAFSTVTGSSTVITKQRVFTDDIKVSLWIQCTLPKIKCTFLSRIENETTFYKVVSEIEEIMFAFDYQDNVLELTNKIASCVIYYSLLRFDHDPKGWVITDDGYLLCQKEKFRVSAHPDSKTLLSVVYRRTHHYSQSILSPEFVESKKTSEPSIANTQLLLQDEHIIKHEVTIHMLSFDVICYSKPILSSLAIFTDLTTPTRNTINVKSTSVETKHNPTNWVVTLPLFSVHCDSVRVIIPVGEMNKQSSVNSVDFPETMFVFHFLSIDLNSSPSNPITKTVTDKALYRHVKLNHRDSLKKLKLWNIQYQLDILNIGLCTANWRSLEGSLPSKCKQIQNPALEWNSKLSRGQSRMTPIFPGFDFKATIAPPVIVEIKGEMYPITAVAFEFHSPREMKLFISSYQIGLALQVMDDFNSLISELNLLFQSITKSTKGNTVSLETIHSRTKQEHRNVTNDSGIQIQTISDNTKIDSGMSVIPSVECFASVSCISIIFYEKQYHQPLIATVYPTLYLNLLQPTFTITSIKEKKAAINLLNCSIHSSSNKTGIKSDILVPSPADFNLELLTCCKGRISSQTGLPPTFLTVAAVLNQRNKISVDVFVGKPLHLKYYAYADQNLKNFYNQLVETLKQKPSSKPNHHVGASAEAKPHLDSFAFQKFSLSMQRVCISGSFSIGTTINLQYQLFTATATLDDRSSKLESIDLNTMCKGVEIFFTGAQFKKRNFLMPLNGELRILASFCPHSGNLKSESVLPRLYMWFHSGLLQLCVNQHIYQLMKEFTQEVASLFVVCNEETNLTSNVSSNVSYENITCELKTSVDDLRNGLLEYVIQDGTEKSLPDINQILFTEENNGIPVMTWKYPEARKIKEIVILPVPFHVSNAVRSCWIEDTEMIPCLLQYWDEISHSFISLERFFLSENESSSLHLNSSIAISSIWQVVVVVPEEISRHHENNTATENMSCPVPSTSLAACMKVTSEYSPEIVPSLQIKVGVETFKILVSNCIKYGGKVTPTQLAPFYVEECGPEMMEALSVSFDELTLDLSTINASNTSLSVSCKVNTNVMDFNNYYWLNVLNPTNIAVHIAHGQSNAVPSTDINLKVGETDFYISQTVVHTLLKTMKAWQNIGNENEEIVLFNHYILSNHTQDILHIQQMNADEDVVLRSGQAYPYSWYSNKEEFLCFAIESVGEWKWSDPIDINEIGIVARRIDHASYTSLIFVETKKLGGLQNQVIFHGSCVFVNNLSCDLQMGVVTQETIHNGGVAPQTIREVSKTFSLPSGVTRPSLTVSTSFIKSLKISKIDDDYGHDGNSLSLEFPLVLNSEEAHHCIQLKDGCGKVYNVWLSLTYNTKILGQLIISISPLFVLRSHLAEPVLINVNDGSSDQIDMVLHGKGREQQVFTMKEKHRYNVSFCLAGSKEYSKPPFTLNTTLSDLLRQDPKNVCSTVDVKWPYIDQLTENMSPSSSHHKVSYKAVTQSDGNVTPQKQTSHTWQQADLIFQPNLRWKQLPTVILDLKPWILICNMSHIDLQIKSNETGYVYSLEKKQTISPFHIKSSFQVGVQSEIGTLWSAAMSVSNDREDAGIETDEALKPGSFSHCSIVDKSKNRCYQFSLLCSQTESIMLICVSERFILHNLSDELLLMMPLMSDDFKSQEFNTLFGLVVPTHSTTACANFNINAKDSVDIPSDLIMNFKKKTDVQIVNLHGDNRCVISNHLVKTAECFHLSKDHLRESMVLGESKCRSELIATSSLENGVIHVFIDTNCSPIVTLTNDSSFTLTLKEVTEIMASKKENRYDILCSDRDLLTLLTPHSSTKYFSKAFKDMFPKCANVIRLNCQFALDSGSTVELSKPILLQKDTNTNVFVPGAGELCVKSFIMNSQLYVHINEKETQLVCPSVPLSLPKFEVSITAINMLLVDYQYPGQVQSLLSTSLCNCKLLHQRYKSKSILKFTLGYLQIDNQLQGSCYHFPVIFLPMRQLSDRYHSVKNDAPFPEIEACLDADFCMLTFEAAQLSSEVFLDNVRINIQPCEMYLEDTFVYRLAAAVDSYSPSTNSSMSQSPNSPAVNTTVLSILYPMKVCNVEIGELSVLLSVHASVKVFLAADHIPLVLGRFKCHPTQTVTKEFFRSMLYHYATQVLVRAGWILGSLELIGNPTGLLHNIGRGVSDFFTLPYNGLIRGPTAFVSGIGQGMTSFLKHVSTGALTSINNVSSSISRNMDRLCFDEMHLLIQEERRAQSPTRVASGVQNAFGSLGLSLLGAVAGIVEHPIQNINNANNTSEVVSGVVSGLAKGMVGIVTKPIGGAMEFISQTSQGILQGVGLVKTPERLIIMQFDCPDDLRREGSQMKFLWQYLRLESFENKSIIPNVSIKTTQDDSQSGVLILTESALFVYVAEHGNIASAYPLREVELFPVVDGRDSNKCTVQVHNIQDSYGQRSHRTPSLDQNPNFRQFFESFEKASAVTHTEALFENLSNWRNDAVLEIEMTTNYCELFMMWYETNKNLMEEEICTSDSLEL